MEKGVHKYWTAEHERVYRRQLAACQSFAQQLMVMAFRDMLKYDGRTRAAKRARAQTRLRLAIATDEELEELARLEVAITPEDITQGVKETLEELKEARARIRKEGIRRSELQREQ